jgi:hypothetical protein
MPVCSHEAENRTVEPVNRAEGIPAMTRTFVTLTTAALILSAVTFAQTRPDFSGTWRMDEARSVSSTHEGYVGPVTWAIQQSPQAMVVDIGRGPKQFTMTFRLFDKQPTGPATEGVPSYRGYWEGDRLVTETTQNIQGQTVTTREVRWLVNANEMVVERVVEVEHGYTMKGAKSSSAAKDYFRKMPK